MRRAALLALTGLASCSAPGPAGEADVRFVGAWLVEQPFHAGYEASWYHFHDDGTLQHLRDCAFGGEVPTGFVTDASGSVRCEFADRWSASDAETLAIAGACSDAREREIVLHFPADTSANATGQPAIEVISVGGESDWGHFQWDWVWQRCGAGDCTPTLIDCR
jgi:hypothetical protein